MSRQRFLSLVALASLLGACRAGPRQPCETTGDCKEGLTCEVWTKDHDEVAGKCASGKCCASQSVPAAVERQREEAAIAARAAQCKAFGSASLPVFQALMKIVDQGQWVGADMANMSRMMTELVAAIEKVELTGELAQLRKELVARAKDFQSACDELRGAMDESKDMGMVKARMPLLQKKYDALGVPVKKYNRVCAGVTPGDQPSP